MFHSEASLFSGGSSTGSGCGWPKFRHLGAREELNQSLTNKHFVLIDQGISSQLIIYEAQNGSLRVYAWPCHRWTKEASESYLGHRGEGSFLTGSPFPEHKGWVIS